MKTLYYWFIKRTNWILSTCLVLLGFSGFTSCEGQEEYGTPYANFTIKGKVVDEGNKPIPEIRVRVVHKEWDDDLLKSPLIVNQKGEFETKYTDTSDGQYRLIVRDIDGPKNGSFKDDTIAVTFTKEDYYKTGKGWSQGDALKEVNIVLKEKKEE